MVVCAGCDEPILDRFLLNVLDRTWHADCVQCCECKANLSEKCFSKDGKLYCRVDFNRRFGAKCFGCGEDITSAELVRKARDRVYHLKCFNCVACGKQLSTGEELYMLEESKFLCKRDYLAKFKPFYVDHQIQLINMLHNKNNINNNDNSDNTDNNNNNNKKNENNSINKSDNENHKTTTATNIESKFLKNKHLSSHNNSSNNNHKSNNNNNNDSFNSSNNENDDFAFSEKDESGAEMDEDEIDDEDNDENNNKNSLLMNANNNNANNHNDNNNNDNDNKIKMIRPKLEEGILSMHNSDSLDSMHSIPDTKPLCDGDEGGGGRGGPICEEGRILGISTANQSVTPVAANKTSSDLPKDSTSVDGGSTGAGKRRGPRTTIKAKQLETLKAAFAATPKPTRHIREQLAQETGLNMRVIQVWFQNRRSKERRMKQLSALGVRRQFYRNPRRSLRPGEDLVDEMAQNGFNYFLDNGDFYPAYPGYHDYFPPHPDDVMTYMAPPSSSGPPQGHMIDTVSGNQLSMHEAAFLASEINPMINRALNNSPLNMAPGNGSTGNGNCPNGRLNGGEHHLLLEHTQAYPLHLHPPPHHLHPLHQPPFQSARFPPLRHQTPNNLVATTTTSSSSHSSNSNNSDNNSNSGGNNNNNNNNINNNNNNNSMVSSNHHHHHHHQQTEQQSMSEIW